MIHIGIYNQEEELLRTIRFEGPQGFVVFNRTERRLELVSTEIKDPSLTVIASFRAKDLLKKPLILQGFGSLRPLQEDDQPQAVVYGLSDQSDFFGRCLKWSGLTHAFLLILILSMGLVIEKWLTPEKKTVQVMVQAKLAPKPVAKPKKVQMAEKKIVPTKKKANSHRSRKKVVGQKSKPLKKVAKVTRHQTQKRPSISNVGALGALGGSTRGSKQSSGLLLDSATPSKGSSKSAQSGGRGGSSRALLGKGLVASGVGRGQRAEGAGGYETRGAGGGQAGYGQHQMAGSSAAYTQPLEEEALIAGGLDRDQVAAVIQRNIGQIVYCYEKGLQTNPKLRGRVTMAFEINPQGRVARANPQVSSLNSDLVESCMSQKIKSWKFPKPVGNVSVKVTYPFVLKRLSHG